MKQKGLRKLVSIVLMVVMVLAMSATAFAATITIENTTTNKTYTAYKIFDATAGDNNAVSYTIDSSSAWYSIVSAATDVFTLTQAGQESTTYYVTVKDGVEDADVIAVFASVPAGATVAGTATGTGGSVNLTGLDSGYYYITTNNGTAVTINTTTDNVKVIDKNQTPGGDLSKVASESDAQIGDTIEYTITSNVPAYDGTTKITNYTFKDTLSDGLTAPKASDVTVTIKDASGNIVLVDEGVISVSVSNQVITVSYNPESISGYPADATITISYTATVNIEATYENGNSVTQTWTGDSTGETRTETVYTYGFNLKKVDGTDKKQLSGAKFKLYTALTGGEEITFSYDEENEKYTVDPDGDVTEIKVGSATVFGLDSDVTYYLEETQAPAGYNILGERVEVTIEEDGTSVSDGVVTITQNVQVENNSGSALPSTGGMGTTIFYIVGGVLVLGAAVLFVTKKRLGGEN